MCVCVCAVYGNTVISELPKQTTGACVILQVGAAQISDFGREEKRLPYHTDLLTPKALGNLGGVFMLKDAELENILKSPLMKNSLKCLPSYLFVCLISAFNNSMDQYQV